MNIDAKILNKILANHRMVLIHHINKLKNKNHMIILIDEEKHSQNPTPIYGRNSQQSGYRGNVPPHKKSQK